MNAIEAFNRLKKENQRSVVAYTMFRGSHVFCYEDPESLAMIDDEEGTVKELVSHMGLIFDHIDDETYCDELNAACNNAKPIEEILKLQETA